MNMDYLVAKIVLYKSKKEEYWFTLIKFD
jgi:hypothetical protein